jgi:hypothetical protein
MVLIYSNEYPSYMECPKVDMLHWVGSVKVESVAPRANDYKEHLLRKRSYEDVIKWCQKYATAHKEYTYTHMNCRRFVMRLAEYCGISTDEVDAQMTKGVAHIGSQYYTVRDTGSEVIDGGISIVKGKVLTGGAKILAAPVRGAFSLTAKGVAEAGHFASRTTETVRKGMGLERRGRYECDSGAEGGVERPGEIAFTDAVDSDDFDRMFATTAVPMTERDAAETGTGVVGRAAGHAGSAAATATSGPASEADFDDDFDAWDPFGDEDRRDARASEASAAAGATATVELGLDDTVFDFGVTALPR